MARSGNSSGPQIPAALIRARREGWQHFTRAIVITGASIATVLILMLIFLHGI